MAPSPQLFCPPWAPAFTLIIFPLHFLGWELLQLWETHPFPMPSPPTLPSCPLIHLPLPSSSTPASIHSSSYYSYYLTAKAWILVTSAAPIPPDALQMLGQPGGWNFQFRLSFILPPLMFQIYTITSTHYSPRFSIFWEPRMHQNCSIWPHLILPSTFTSFPPSYCHPHPPICISTLCWQYMSSLTPISLRLID